MSIWILLLKKRHFHKVWKKKMFLIIGKWSGASFWDIAVPHRKFSVAECIICGLKVISVYKFDSVILK